MAIGIGQLRVSPPELRARGPKGRRMIVQIPRCRMCARPVVAGRTAHLGCQELPESLNDWPGGSRQLSCLACDRPFRSDSKTQRLCHACRSGARPGAH